MISGEPNYGECHRQTHRVSRQLVEKGERCIAGKELLEDGLPGAWVRPVSNRENEAVNGIERQYRDGSEPAVLDVIDVPLVEARPNGHQQENWLLDPDHYWTREKRASVDDLYRLVDPVGQLWANGFPYSGGLNNRVPESKAKTLDHSLRLIQIDEMALNVYSHSAPFSNVARKRINGRFHYGGTEYNMRVTDPLCEREFSSIGIHQIGKCFLTISLGEAFTDGYCYKLIAAVNK